MDVLRQLKRMPKYISQLAIWIWQARAFIWLLGAIFAASMPWLLFSCLEQRIRFSGVALQLIGVILVAVGLIDTRKAFEDQPTTWQAIKQMWAGRPRLKPRNVVLAASAGAFGMIAGSARGRVSPGPNTPFDRRIELLEQQYRELFDEVGKLSAEAKQKVGELSNAVSVERSERQQGDQSLKDQLRKAVAGGLPLGRVGAICFFIGILAASISSEIAKLFGGGACPA